MNFDAGGRMQTAENPIIVANRLSGMETLDLSVAKPESTGHLALGKSHDVRFQRKSKETPQGSAWELDAEDDELELILTLPYKHGVNLIVELCRTEPGKTDEPPVVITINDRHELDLDLDPNNLNFQKQAWYVPQYMLKKDENRITLKLAPKAGTTVLLRSASVMRFDLQPQEKDNWCWAAVTASLNKFFKNGFPIRQDEVVRDVLEDAPEKARYKITEQSLRSLKTKGLPEDVLEKLQGIKNQEGRDKFRFLALLKETGIEDERIVQSILEHAKDDDVTITITDALDTMGLQSMRCYYTISLDEIRRQMRIGLPVVIRVQPEGGSGHFVVITGVCPRNTKKDDRTMLRVADPSNKLAVIGKGTIYIAYNMLKKQYRGDREWTHTYLFEKEGERRTRR